MASFCLFCLIALSCIEPGPLSKAEQQHIEQIVCERTDSAWARATIADAGSHLSVPGYSLHEELELYAKAGLSNYDVLKTATVNGARLLGLDDDIGTLQVGKRADLIFLDDNPLDGLQTLRHPTGLMIRGRWFDDRQLDSLRQTL